MWHPPIGTGYQLQAPSEGWGGLGAAKRLGSDGIWVRFCLRVNSCGICLLKEDLKTHPVRESESHGQPG